MGITSFLDDVIKRLDELEEEEKRKVYCSECSKDNNKKNKYCIYCGHKLKKIDENDKAYSIYCINCGERLSKDDLFCGSCGTKVNKKRPRGKICAVCGEWISNNMFYWDGNDWVCDDRFCWNCGHDRIGKWSSVRDIGEKNLIKGLFATRTEEQMTNLRRPKKCPNCNSEFQRYFNYCERCGTKLKIKHDK